MDLLAAIIPDFTTGVFLFVAIGLALSFEFVNGFHDTANAVATVIYTNTLRPVVAVIWSGLWNLIGVLTSTGAVAYGIVALLPVELVLNVGSGAGFAMVFALLVSAIIWNLGTWYFGLPASSSHTLIGSILGVGLANSLMAGHPFGTGVNWAKAQEVGMSLVLSPLIGFAVSALLLLLLKAVVKSPKLFTPPEKDQAPPIWIRGLLMLTCTGVSFAHGSNDGQKGMGLMVLILVGILPGTFALKMDENQQDLQAIMSKVHDAQMVFVKYAIGQPVPESEAAQKAVSAYLKSSAKPDAATYSALASACGAIDARLLPLKSFGDLSESDRRALRTQIYLTSSAIAEGGQVEGDHRSGANEHADRGAEAA
ncbi:MAG: inorganic phosphate transporter [Chthoniobacteraceae bacterium]